MRPDCLKVDKAINLLKSNSKLAPSSAINKVNPETNNKTIFNQQLKEGLKRVRYAIPLNPRL